MKARDADEGDNSKVRYEIVEESTGQKSNRPAGRTIHQRNNRGKTTDRRGSNRKQIFSIDPVTGEIKLTGPLDELQEKYHVTVNAFDAGMVFGNV